MQYIESLLWFVLCSAVLIYLDLRWNSEIQKNLSSILVSEFVRAIHQRTAACKVVSKWCQNLHVPYIKEQLFLKLCPCFRIRVIDLKHEGCVHPRCKNDPMIRLTHLLNWPPLTLMFIGPIASLIREILKINWIFK